MSLFEVVLDAGDQEEVRLTDEPLMIGDVLEIQGAYWEVVREQAIESETRARYYCRPAQEGGDTADEVRLRAEATRTRLDSRRRLLA